MAMIINNRLQIYVASALRASAGGVLEYNRNEDRLRVWQWPAANNARVRPNELCNHRISHQFQGPCCLCPKMDAQTPDFVESAIQMVMSGPYSGEYVARCAQDRCGYFVSLDRIYGKLGIFIRFYPPRELGERVPLKVTHISERAPQQPRPLKRTYAMIDFDEDQLSARSAPRADPNYKSISELLAQLDAYSNPGITATEFR